MKKSVVKNGYVFEIQEVENDNGQIVRRYEKGGQKNQRSAGIEEAKALLLAMGLDEKIINSLPEEKLLCVAGSNFVQSAESYIKTGKDNSVVYLDKETALQEASQVKKQQDVYIENLLQGISPLEEWEASNGYIRLHYVVLYLGNAKYAFMNSATWLTAPINRGWDSIGACAMGSTVDNSARWGEYSCDMLVSQNGIVTTTTIKPGVQKYQNAVNGNWYGSALVFLLPANVVNSNEIRIYNNFSATYWYSGYREYPGLESYFNTTGTYDHAYIGINFNPNVSISLNGTSTCIGLAPALVEKNWSIEFLVHYVP